MKVKIIPYLNLIKISHTVFSLPFAFIGAVLGYRDITIISNSWMMFVFVALCLFFARSTAMLFNRYADAHWDAQNPRTLQREIPKGIFSRNTVLFFTAINAMLFVFSTYFINKTVFLLSPVALFIILGYSYTKRFTYLSHIWLGVSLALAPIGAYLVFNPAFSFEPVLFGIVTIFWVSGFDIIYATQDVNFDQKAGLLSIPVKVGVKKALVIAQIFHSLAIITVVITGITYKYSFLFWVGTIVFASLLLAEHFIIRKNNSNNTINMAFATYNSFAGLLFGCFVILDLCLR
ncbi:MAG: putative 4-hydroxybenzoate polyprenyltransferase [Bacteroidales bacterium]|nr:putative 4-hydroxybenzoate polyprenyltransferase [Bacteroidales bacterium]